MFDLIDLRSGGSGDLLSEKLRGRNSVTPPEVLETVGKILDAVKLRGDEALLEYTRQYDKVSLAAADIRVTEEEIAASYKTVDQGFLGVLKRAMANIEAFHAKQKENSWFMACENGAILGQLYRPLEIVGIYVPGGTAALASSVLMNAIPAKAAGVPRIIMATPPGPDGKVDPAILAAADMAGVHEIYRMGGAQAVAAMAYGTAAVPRVDKIFGPGNIYVATAKRMVFGYCGIDMFAGPSEIAVVADDTADPEFVAADLLSQAEHDPLASAMLVTPSEKMAAEVKKEVEKQYRNLSRKDILEKSLSCNSAAILVKDIGQAIDIVNGIAPEHLELCVANPFDLLGRIRSAGAIFLGNFASEPLGDYIAGPNHILPTGGTARFFSPLGVSDFIKKSSVISYTRKALEDAGDDARLFALSEGLDAHANAIGIRFGK